MESKIVTAVGVSVNHVLGPDVSKRLEKVVTEAILQCNAEGISTEDKNSDIIRTRMAEAYQRELEKIERGE